MAQKVQVILTDDLDGGDIDVETLRFGLDGIDYEIDLGRTNAEALRAALERYEASARRTGGKRKPGTNGASRGVSRAAARLSSGAPEPGHVRAWAMSTGGRALITQNGLTLPSDRGRISADVMALYATRDQAPAKAEPTPEPAPQPAVFQEAATEPQEAAQEAVAEEAPKPAPRKRAPRKSVIPK